MSDLTTEQFEAARQMKHDLTDASESTTIWASGEDLIALAHMLAKRGWTKHD